jgi:hypothetical protein
VAELNDIIEIMEDKVAEGGGGAFCLSNRFWQPKHVRGGGGGGGYEEGGVCGYFRFAVINPDIPYTSIMFHVSQDIYFRSDPMYG